MRARLLVLALPTLLSLAACGVHNPPLDPRPTTTPIAGPLTAPDGETPEQAAVRLFPEARARELELGTSPRELNGLAPGRPVPLSQDYVYDAEIARWVLADDLKAVSGDMFAAMWPIAMEKCAFLVPLVKNGRVQGDFLVARHNDEGWKYIGTARSKVHAGQLFDLQLATDKLRRLLGPEARVRPVVFVPSGMVFAVGDYRGREAVVYLGHSWRGPGIGNLDIQELPEVGTVLKRAALEELLRRAEP